MPIPLSGNALGYPVEGGVDLGPVRTSLESGRLGQFADEPVPQQTRHQVDLLPA